MKVSVIITVYNLEKYLVPALQSVFLQTYQPHEIIVIDDCSTDSSNQVLEQYLNKIRYIKNEENLGVLLSTIKGIKLAEGDVLCFLDGDDIWQNTKIEKVIQVFQKDSSFMLVTHNHSYISKDGNKLNKQDDTHLNIKRVISEANGDNLILSDLLKKSMLSYSGVWLGSAYCIKKDALNIQAFEKWALSFPNERLSYQDHPLAQYLVLNNPDKLIGFVNEPLLKYRIFGLNSSGASYDLNSALRTLNKLESTTIRTYSLVSSFPVDAEIVKRQQAKLYEVNYLKSLYKGENQRAIKLYFKLVKLKWTKKQAVKELARVIGSIVLGKKVFFKLKSTM